MSISALRQGAFGPNYIYLKILQKYKFDSDDLHYVFEGYDDQSFYFNFLQNVQNNIFTYITSGKNNSIDVYKKLDWSVYDKKRIVIFIDRDYSRLLCETITSDVNIYETTYYSIENYISNNLILRRLINEILHFYEDEKVESIIEKFDRNYKLFFTWIKPVIVWILLIRSHNLKANLNQIDLSNFFKIDDNLDLIKEEIDRIEYLERVTQTKTPNATFSEFKHWYSLIEQQPSEKLVIRGKFDAWHLVAYFNKVNGYLNRKYGFKSKVKTNINLSNAVEIIGPRTIIPNRLDAFIKALNL